MKRFLIHEEISRPSRFTTYVFSKSLPKPVEVKNNNNKSKYFGSWSGEDPEVE